MENKEEKANEEEPGLEDWVLTTFKDITRSLGLSDTAAAVLVGCLGIAKALDNLMIPVEDGILDIHCHLESKELEELHKAVYELRPHLLSIAEAIKGGEVDG
jgi:hypothetical protein